MTSGDPGFTNLYPRKLPDGTIVWTSPSGCRYTTRPGDRLLFPSLCTPRWVKVVVPSGTFPAISFPPQTQVR